MIEFQQMAGVSHTLQTVALASLVIAVIAYLPKINLLAQLRRFPDLAYDNGAKKRQTYLDSASRLYAEGYKQFKDRAWRLANDDGRDTIVVGPQFLPELRKLPDSVVSFPAATHEMLACKYTGMNVDDDAPPHVVRSNLTPGLVRLNPQIAAEIERATDSEMPQCDDWEEVGIYMKLVRIVAMTSGLLFVGPDLARNEDYLDAAIWYTIDLFKAINKVKEMHPWLRPIFAPRLKEIRTVHERRAEATKMIAPVVQARRAAQKDPSYTKPDDALQWIMDDVPNYSNEKLADAQLGLIMAAIHTTSIMCINILYSLAATPEYFEPLREEIRAVRAEHDGQLTFRALQKLEKLDSYMKEVIRFYPMSTSSFNRKALKGFTLSNGQYVPAGVNIEVAKVAIYQDDVFFPDADKFDGFRSYKIRQEAGNHAHNQFVSTNESNLLFGYGRHACPGRFFAANEIKLLVAKLVMDYDFKNADGTTERYQNAKPIGRSLNPDTTKKLLFKKASV